MFVTCLSHVKPVFPLKLPSSVVYSCMSYKPLFLALIFCELCVCSAENSGWHQHKAKLLATLLEKSFDKFRAVVDAHSLILVSFQRVKKVRYLCTAHVHMYMYLFEHTHVHKCVCVCVCVLCIYVCVCYVLSATVYTVIWTEY